MTTTARKGKAVRVAGLFPGQGSQRLGMAEPWLSHDAAQELLTRLSRVWGRDVVALASDESSLSSTELVQPLIFSCDLAAFRALQAEGVELSAAAGHSLGEFAALAAAGAAEPEAMLSVVLERGRAMQEAAAQAPGAMTALIGLHQAEAIEVCRVAGRGDVLEVANENAPSQIVVSGSVEAIERAEELARTRGAKAVRLNVAGGFHSPLMRPAMQRVRDAISRIELREPRIPVVPNATGRPTREPSVIRDALSRHLVSPVRWERSIRALAGLGADLFVEMGPGEVLTKLVRRILPDTKAVAVRSPDDLAGLHALTDAPAAVR
jgi:[acyl-carrier-protein] S-malonyltransferase